MNPILSNFIVFDVLADVLLIILIIILNLIISSYHNLFKIFNSIICPLIYFHCSVLNVFIAKGTISP